MENSDLTVNPDRCETRIDLYGRCRLYSGHDGPHRVAWYGEDGEHIVTWNRDLDRMHDAYQTQR
jgi:hypothetical protein